MSTLLIFFIRFFSYLPLFVLKFLSWILYLINHIFIQYRKDIVKSNLSIAFPNKSSKQISKITDLFLFDNQLVSLPTPKKVDKLWPKLRLADLSKNSMVHLPSAVSLPSSDPVPSAVPLHSTVPLPSAERSDSLELIYLLRYSYIRECIPV